MELDKAKWALENIFARIEKDPIGGNWKLNGSVTSGEREAFVAILSHLASSEKLLANPQSDSSPSLKYPLNVESTLAGEDIDNNAMLCLDFGTARSKAFALLDDAPLDLAIGQRAGYTESVYSLPSSLFISSGGKIFFGHEAISESLNDLTPGRQRFDSPKQELSQGSMANLSTASVGVDINPSGVSFTKDDLITLYLAYLTDMACTELVVKHQQSRYMRRRFARPCWKDDRVKWAEELLTSMLGRAQILADTFSGKWLGGLDVKGVRLALDQLASVTPPAFLIVGSVEEPVAAAASIVLEGERRHPGFLVVDVGAGTTDFGLFVTIQPPGREPKIYRLPGSIHGIRQAGDSVDNMLRAFILSKHSIDGQSPYGARIGAELNLRIRSYKETLFQNKSLTYRLGDDSSGEIALSDFEESPEVQRFSSSLRDAVKLTFDQVDKSWLVKMFRDHGILVVLTGGGARLPMVRRLTEGWIESYGMRMSCSPAAEVPIWIQQNYPDFIEEYPQLAVAMGGAATELPEMGPDTPAFPGIGAATYIAGNLPLKGI